MFRPINILLPLLSSVFSLLPSLPFSPLSLSLSLSLSLILNYGEGVAMLRANGVEIGDEDDLR